MSSAKIVAKSGSRSYLRRYQPEAQKHLGVLQKKKDYKLHSRICHVKEKLKKVKKKALNKSPDEFCFHMINSEVKKIDKLSKSLANVGIEDNPKSADACYVDSKSEVIYFDPVKKLTPYPKLLDKPCCRQIKDSLKNVKCSLALHDKTHKKTEKCLTPTQDKLLEKLEIASHELRMMLHEIKVKKKLHKIDKLSKSLTILSIEEKPESAHAFYGDSKSEVIYFDSVKKLTPDPKLPDKPSCCPAEEAVKSLQLSLAVDDETHKKTEKCLSPNELMEQLEIASQDLRVMLHELKVKQKLHNKNGPAPVFVKEVAKTSAPV